MSTNTDSKMDPSARKAESKPVQAETEHLTSLKDADGHSKGEGGSSTEKPTYTELATHAASTAASGATAVAAGVKDNVFSMFGGGGKKEKKDEAEGGADEPSGSSKAKKDAEGEVSGCRNP